MSIPLQRVIVEVPTILLTVGNPAELRIDAGLQGPPGPPGPGVVLRRLDVLVAGADIGIEMPHQPVGVVFVAVNGLIQCAPSEMAGRTLIYPDGVESGDTVTVLYAA